MAKNARTTTNENPVQTAERTLRELQEKHDRVSAARAEDDREMGRVSLAAHSGDAEASKQLNTIVERMIRRDLELKSIASAIAQAQNNLAEARAEEARAGERRAMQEARKLAQVFREAGKKADEALVALDEAADDMRLAVGRLGSMGINNPSSMQLMSLGERAILTSLMRHPWARAFSHTKPSERRTFSSFLSEWAASLERMADAKIKSHKEGGERAA